MPRRRRVKRQRSVNLPPSARGRVLVQESLPEGNKDSLRHSAGVEEPKAVPAPKKVTPKPKPKPAPKKAAAPKSAPKVEKPAPKPKEEPKKEPKRARKEGKFVGDDPATPEKNEAWEGGKAPEPKKKWDADMTKRELCKFLSKKSKLTVKSSKDAILKELEKSG